MYGQTSRERGKKGERIIHTWFYRHPGHSGQRWPASGYWWPRLHTHGQFPGYEDWLAMATPPHWRTLHPQFGSFCRVWFHTLQTNSVTRPSVIRILTKTVPRKRETYHNLPHLSGPHSLLLHHTLGSACWYNGRSYTCMYFQSIALPGLKTEKVQSQLNNHCYSL